MTRVQLDFLEPALELAPQGGGSLPETPIALTARDLQYARNIDLRYATGIPTSYFSAWDRGRIPSTTSIQSIATALNVPYEVVFEGLALRRADRIYAIEVSRKLQSFNPVCAALLYP